MAVAGLQNVSRFGPSFFGESSSSMSNASSVLQMWRELENEHAVNHSRNKSMEHRSGPGSECCSTTTSVGQGSENGDDISENGYEFENQGITEDNNSVSSEPSSDFGEIERKRVRQIFREWMNSGGKVHSFNRFRPGAEWLGENECGRVRIIREWVQMNMQQGNNCGSNGDGFAESDSQIEQVRDGVVINHPEIGGRRPIRRLCGRQTLIDLLVRAQRERERELQGLSEQRTVSDFPHRNRIQALLRGRFLRNQRMVPDERPPVKAATELGMLLKQRQTVSDLREGFLSRMDSSASTSSNNVEDDSSGPEINGALEDMRRGEEVTMIRTVSDIEISADVSMGEQELTEHISDIQDQVLGNGGNEQQTVSFNSRSDCNNAEEPVLTLEASEQEIVPQVDLLESIHDEQNTESLLETEDTTNSVETLGVSHEHSVLRNGIGDVHITESGINANEEFNLPNTSAEFFQEISTDQWFNGASGSVEEQHEMMESHEQWPIHDLQEAVDSWLDSPTAHVVGSSLVGRIGPSYYSDDDNVQNTELRELSRRGRVSNLLGSGFRESLNQVLQSHVERLGGHATSDWESENGQEEQEQQTVEQNSALRNGNPFAQAPALVSASDPLWNEDFHDTNWMHSNFNQQFGTEYEVINDLRIDMARLQQRMKEMQSMLETCMEMQIELQRTVRQEVSAALNRPNLSQDTVASKCQTTRDESHLDQIRRGICCLCSHSNIDSLLYRCGHMCTCSKCADNLVEGAGKCPMCEAPVVDVVRAYFAQ